MARITGGERVVTMLAAEGVDTVFGIIDGSYFGLYSRLGEYGIRLVTPRHETTAVHMAGAYARLTGRLGVCIASNGPGVANALPGVAVENGEGNRVLLVTSWRRSPIVAPDRGGTYQYFDQVAVTRPMTKWSGAASTFERVPEMFRRALRIAWQGRPGVVHVCVPEDVLNGEFDAPATPDPAPARYRRQAPIAPDPAMVRHATDLLVAADLPMIHVGSGVLHAGAAAELRAVAEQLPAPVTTSWGARDVVDERSAVATPMPFVDLVQRVRNDADVVLALGTRFGETDWWGKPPYWRAAAEQRVIQVDVDEQVLGLNKPVDLAILADVRTFLGALAAELAGRDFSHVVARREERLREYAAARTDARTALDAHRPATGTPLHSAHVAPICQEVFDGDAVLVIDGGNTAIWANLYHEARVPHSLLSTWKFGMLGAGAGQALGAQVAYPGRQVYCITGDGAMGFHPQEIETAVRNDLPVVFLVLCDRAWGMVKVNQEFAIDPDRLLADGALPDDAHINTDLGEIRWDLLADSMGAHGERVSSAEELRPALERCLAARRCAVVHLDVDPVAHKFAPNLLTFREMHAEPSG
ncbi:MAG: thiamine pyrophosphate-binding protein [Acidimicrobiia bacterium]